MVQSDCVKLPRKPSKHRIIKSVPQTDTGRLVEYTKTNEKTKFEELGKFRV